ncbi:MAG: hypothetical protein EBU96_09965 [Actinobacteria bacterium]|nr:hypothetical protein [Actinomycetota bacterium]
MRSQMLVAYGQEYCLPLGRPNVLAIADRLPFGVAMLVTFRSFDRLSFGIATPFVELLPLLISTSKDVLS